MTKHLMAIFVDGEPSGQTALTSKPLQCDAPFMIGAQPPGGSGPLQGVMDEVSLFKVGISDDDVKRLMNEGLKQFLTSVESAGKLATTWGNIRR